MLPVWHGTGTIPRGCLLEKGRDLSMLADDEVLLNALGEEVGRICCRFVGAGHLPRSCWERSAKERAREPSAFDSGDPLVLICAYRATQITNSSCDLCLLSAADC